MKTSTWHKGWVYGLYDSTPAAEAFVRQAESGGVPRADLVVITPSTARPERVADIPTEKHHPEWKWGVTGGAIGFVLGNVAGHLLMHAVASDFNWIGTMLISLIPGFGGLVAGTFFGLQMSGADASLNALYEESGAEGKVMVAIKCDPKRPDKMDDVEQMFLRSGVKPVEFPRIH